MKLERIQKIVTLGRYETIVGFALGDAAGVAIDNAVDERNGRFLHP